MMILSLIAILGFSHALGKSPSAAPPPAPAAQKQPEVPPRPVPTPAPPQPMRPPEPPTEQPPALSLKENLEAIDARSWPASVPIREFLANGRVRVVILKGPDIPEPPSDFWRMTCDDPAARCVVVIPAFPHNLPAQSANLVPVILDETRSQAMRRGVTVYVYDVQGRPVHVDTYRDLNKLQTVLHPMLPALAIAGMPPVVSDQQPGVRVTSGGTTRVITNTVPAPPPNHSAKPANPTTATTTATSTAPPPPPVPALPTLASLNAQVAPLFGTGRTSFLRLDPVRDAQKHSKRVVLCFWATSCKACVQELSELARIRDENPNSVFIGLLDDSDRDEIRLGAQDMAPDSFPLHYFLLDDKIQRALFGSSKLILPAFAIFDDRGRLRDRFYGSLLADHKNYDRLVKGLRQE